MAISSSPKVMLRSVSEGPIVRTLVVEDNPTSQKIITSALKSVGIPHRLVDNGIDAVKKIEKSKKEFNLIIIDQNMPKGNGNVAIGKIIKILKDRNYPFCIIYQSDQSKEESDNNLADAGISDDDKVKYVVTLGEKFIIRHAKGLSNSLDPNYAKYSALGLPKPPIVTDIKHKSAAVSKQVSLFINEQVVKSHSDGDLGAPKSEAAPEASPVVVQPKESLTHSAPDENIKGSHDYNDEKFK